MEKDVNLLIKDVMKGIKEVIDSNTIIGAPIMAGGVTILPITKVNVGFVAGGGEMKINKRQQNFPFAGASTSGFSLTPVGFISVANDTVTYYDIDGGAVSKNVMNMANKILDKVLEKKNEE